MLGKHELIHVEQNFGLPD